MRVIPKRSKVVWWVEALLFVLALFTGSWWLGFMALMWFAAWEAKGVVSDEEGDTLSESVWKILAVRGEEPVRKALYPLVMGLFAGAGVLFVGLVVSGGGAFSVPAWDAVMGVWYRGVAAGCVSLGVLGFLARHFWRGDSR